ncbi:MAG TPA: hypothetical protein VLL27_12090 [Solirubrobacterales bacterium]|nr:hypothetical protein [Solirubrobacterales bacterium]
MNHAKNRSRARLGGLLALALGVAALLAIPVVSAARQGADDGPNHEANHEQGHHHRHHGHHRSVIGTISSFDADSGVLTIDLRRSGEVSGVVDAGTKIKCEGADDNGVHRQRHGGDRARRSGEPEPGDDHGGGDSSGSGNSGSGRDDNGRGANCTTAALVAGAVVQEADLEVEHGVRHFDEVELSH